MRKWWIWVPLGLLGLIVAAIVVLGFVNLGPFVKSWVLAGARDSTGRELKIDGDLHLSLLPQTRLEISGLRLANRPGAADPEMVSIGHLAVEVDPWPLIGSRVVVNRIAMSDFKIVLEKDKAGAVNWAMKGKEAGAEREETKETGGGGGLTIADMRLERGSITYIDAGTGQRVEIGDIDLAAALPDLASPFILKGHMVVNKDPVEIDLSLDSPKALDDGSKVALRSTLSAKRIKLAADGSFAGKPSPAGSGRLDLDIPSVGDLAKWLGRPLGAAQPDPGPLAMHVEFAGEGQAILLKQMTLKGTGLDAHATGRFEQAGGATNIVLDLEGGVLDLARYLPPPAVRTPETAPPKETGGGRIENPFAALPTEPFDIKSLRSVDADVKATLGGVKMPGLELGRIALVAVAKQGVVKVELQPLALAKGNVSGRVDLDATGDALGVKAGFKLDNVDLDALGKLAGQADMPVAGILSVALDAAGSGANPRALAENLSGRLAVDMPKASVGAVSQIQATFELPKGDGQPSLKATAVYNGEPVQIDVLLAPLRKMLADDRFPLTLNVSAKPLTVSYSGNVQQRPAPGLDGKFLVNTPSLAKLAAWVGAPLGGPDPGALKIQATLASGGTKSTLTDATIDSTPMALKASGNLDSSGAVPQFFLDASIERANLDALMPPQKAGAAGPGGGSAAAPAPSQGWSAEPIDFAPLKQANGEINVAIGTMKYHGLDISKGRLKATLQGGVLKADLSQLGVAGGSAGFSATVDGSQPVGRIAYRASGQGIQALPLLKAFADTERLSGTLELEAKGAMAGRSQKELIAALDGGGRFAFRDGAINGIDIPGTLRRAGSLGVASSGPVKTDFSELSGSYTLDRGVLQNKDLKMLAPLMRLGGAGKVDLPPRLIDYLAEAKLVASLQGQGGQDALAGVPIPIHIAGPLDKPSYGIDWKSVLGSMDPAQLAKLPSDFKKLGAGLGIKLPSLPGTGDTTGGVLGGTTQQLQNLIPGTAPEQPPPADAGTTKQKPKKPLVPSVDDTLKGLFGN